MSKLSNSIGVFENKCDRIKYIYVLICCLPNIHMFSEVQWVSKLKLKWKIRDIFLEEVKLLHLKAFVLIVDRYVINFLRSINVHHWLFYNCFKMYRINWIIKINFTCFISLSPLFNFLDRYKNISTLTIAIYHTCINSNDKLYEYQTMEYSLENIRPFNYRNKLIHRTK